MLTERAHSRTSLLWQRVVGGTLVFTGVGHLLTEALAPASAERRTMMETMRSWQLSLPGATRSVEDLFLGFSLLMGILLVGLGALIVTMRPTRASQLVTAVLTVVVAGVAWRYLFAVPGVLTSLAAVAALGAVSSSRPPTDVTVS